MLELTAKAHTFNVMIGLDEAPFFLSKFLSSALMDSCDKIRFISFTFDLRIKLLFPHVLIFLLQVYGELHHSQFN